MDVFGLGFGIFIIIFHIVNGEDCVFKKPCSCNTDDYKIDLSPIMKHSKKPLFVTYLGAQYYLDPCGKALTVEKCKKLGPEASGCQLQGSYAYGIAKTTGYTASGDPKAGTVTFTYSYGEASNMRTTKLKVKCSSHERKLTCSGEHPTMTYNFELETKYACKHAPSSGDSGGLSTGSILVILFFVLLFVYIIVGILFLKYYRKEEGVNLIPNREFWKEIPFLVKDGVVFTVSKVRGNSTYEKI